MVLTRLVIITLVLSLALSASFSGAAESKAGEVIRKLQRSHFMLGLGSGPGDGWIDETRKQGAAWDMRYQYFCGGVNTPSNWKTWNQPAGAFASLYLNESAKMGLIPCLSWYQMLQSLPGHGKGGEDVCNKINCENAQTMNAYFEDFKLLMKKCGEFGKPVVVHHEPDLWGFMRISPVFAPNDPDKVKVMVKSSGCAEAADFPDTAAGFGLALVAIRDKYAPNVLLAWHASKWGQPDAAKMAGFILKSGKWDLLFTDFSDRDSAWKIAKNYHVGGAWWEEKDFVGFRDWCGELYKLTGLPIMAWQVPCGNTIMASCNNTDGHYMDNRPQYFLENYPENKNIAEWVQRGFIGLLFGGGAAHCTSRGDGMKDGITNPEPIKGNKGEKAQYADDDGGYLRLRGVNYYSKGPYPLAAPPPAAKAAPAQVAPAASRKLNENALAEYESRLRQRINAVVKSGKKPEAFVRVAGKAEKYALAGADEKNLLISVQGNALPVSWKTLSLADRVNVAKSLASDDDAESLLLVAVFFYADGDAAKGDEFAAKAALKDAKAADALKAILQ
ncbi:MAG TPA: hypothetical protein VEK08_05590 [Planctomycetota bacterium]|nr:hypothetical protein [Planctomycetota bacterium]